MQFIPKLINSLILNSELNNHGSNVVKIIQDANIEDETLNELTDELVVENDKLTLALKKELQNEFTATLRRLDDLRDNGFVCLRGHVKADTTRLNDTIAKAANVIYRIFKNHGLTLHRKSYEQESALLESLFKELDKADMQQELVVLGLTAVYEELKQAQSNFHNNFVLRSASAPNVEELIAASRAHKPVKRLLGLLTQYINVKVDRKKAPFEALAVSIGDLVNNINQKIRTRKTINSEKEDTSDSSTKVEIEK